jgi:D-threo-aldose 1-dehydrogenase
MSIRDRLAGGSLGFGERHGVPIKAAAPHFVLAHPAVVWVIPGASRPERIIEDYVALNTVVPDYFWREMRDQHLVSPDAPLPIDR